MWATRSKWLSTRRAGWWQSGPMDSTQSASRMSRKPSPDCLMWQPISMPMSDTSDPKTPEMDKHMDHSAHPMALMPGMLTPEQMNALRKAKGAEFDHLFLTGMIQHHNGALIMVKDLFDTAGAGQDAELFNFATDADNSQRAEIKIMQSMLEKNPSEPEKKP